MIRDRAFEVVSMAAKRIELEHIHVNRYPTAHSSPEKTNENTYDIWLSNWSSGRRSLLDTSMFAFTGNATI